MGVAWGGRPSQEEAAGPSDMDVARRPRGRFGIVARALRRWRSEAPAGKVAAARERAKVAKRIALSSKLARFVSSEIEARRALAKHDLPRAISQLPPSRRR